MAAPPIMSTDEPRGRGPTLRIVAINDVYSLENLPRLRTLVDIYRNNDYFELLNDRDHRLHHCEVCAFRQYCGGCRARADAYYGQLHAGDPGCLFNDKHWEGLVASGVAVPGDGADAEGFKLSPTRHSPG